MLIPERLLELSRTDTEADQLTHRRRHLVERERRAAALDAVTAWEGERNELRARIDELTGVIDRSEREAADLVTQQERLEAKLKTIIAPREAEALMHEIESVTNRRDELETKEIEALEEQSDVDDRLSAHLAAEAGVRGALAEADAAFVSATDTIDADLAELDAARRSLRDGLDDAVLAQYDRVRGNLGVAVARLVGSRCDGCHLDLSAAEVDDVKDAASATGLADCPHCGRILVV